MLRDGGGGGGLGDRLLESERLSSSLEPEESESALSRLVPCWVWLGGIVGPGGRLVLGGRSVCSGASGRKEPRESSSVWGGEVLDFFFAGESGDEGRAGDLGGPNLALAAFLAARFCLRLIGGGSVMAGGSVSARK